MATQLPIYQIKGKRYYRDKRLGEYRNVNNFEDTIPIDEGDSMVEKPTKKTSGLWGSTGAWS